MSFMKHPACESGGKFGACWDFGSDKPSGQSQTVVNNDPWSGQTPYLTSGFSRAEELFNKPVEYYSGSTVVPFSGQTEQALQNLESRATNGNPLNQAAQDDINATLSGDYLSAGNPYMQNMTDSIHDSVRGAVDSQFSGARYGSAGHAEAMADAVSSNLAPYAFQNYGQERGRQMQAAQLAPQLAMTDYADIGQLQSAGQIREQQAGAELQDQIDRFNFAQNEPRNRVKEFMTTVGGGNYGGSQTSSQPIYSNPLATGLGTAATGVGLANSLFGSPGKGLLSGIF